MRKSQTTIIVQCTLENEKDVVEAFIEFAKALKNKNKIESGHLETCEVNVPVELDL